MIFHPSHPGEVLKDYLGDMTVKEAAQRLGVTRPNLSRILNGRAGISAVMSVRLAKAMPYTSPEFWLKMQINYDLWQAQKNRLPKIRPFPVSVQKKLPQPDLAFSRMVMPWRYLQNKTPSGSPDGVLFLRLRLRVAWTAEGGCRYASLAYSELIRMP